MNRTFFMSPNDALDQTKIRIMIEEGYEASISKFFLLTESPPVFEDPCNGNMSNASVSISELANINAKKYVFSLVNPDNDIPLIYDYTTWFVEIYKTVAMTAEQEEFYNKVRGLNDLFTGIHLRREGLKEAASGQPKVIKFGN